MVYDRVRMDIVDSIVAMGYTFFVFLYHASGTSSTCTAQKKGFSSERGSGTLPVEAFRLSVIHVGSFLCKLYFVIYFIVRLLCIICRAFLIM